MESHLTALISDDSQKRMKSIRALQNMMPIDSNVIRSALKNDELLSIVQEAVGENSRFKSEMGMTDLFKCIEDAFLKMHRSQSKETILLPAKLKEELLSKTFIDVLMEYIGTNNDTKNTHVFTKILNHMSEITGELYIRDNLAVSMHKWKASIDEGCFKDTLHAHPYLFEHIRQFAQHYTTTKARAINTLVQQIYPKSLIHNGVFLTEDDVCNEVEVLRSNIREYIDVTSTLTKILNTIVSNFRLELKTNPRLNNLLENGVWTHMDCSDADSLLELFNTTYQSTLHNFDVCDNETCRKNCNYTPKNKSIIMRLAKTKRPSSVWHLSRFVNVFCAFVESTYLMKPLEQADTDMWNWTIADDKDICMAILGKGILRDPSTRKQSQQRLKNGHVFIPDLQALESSLKRPIQPAIPSPWFWSRENLESMQLIGSHENVIARPITSLELFSAPPYHCAETSFIETEWGSQDVITQTTIHNTSWEANTDMNDALEHLTWLTVGELEHVSLAAKYNDLLMEHKPERLTPFTIDGPNKRLDESVYARCEQVNKQSKLQNYMQNYRMRVWLQYYAMHFKLFKIDPNGIYAIEAAQDVITSRPDCDTVDLNFAGVYRTTISGANLIAKTILDCQLKGEFAHSVVKASANKLYVMCALSTHGETLMFRYGGEYVPQERKLQASRIRFRDASVASFVALHFLLRKHTNVMELNDTDVFFPPEGQLLTLPWQAHKQEYHVIDIHEHDYELTFYDSLTEIGHRHALKDGSSNHRHTHVRFRQPSAVKEKMRHMYFIEKRDNKLVIANPFLTPQYAVSYKFNDIVRLLQVRCTKASLLCCSD